MYVMMTHGPVSLLLLLLLLNHHSLLRHVRGRGRRDVLGHFQALLGFTQHILLLIWCRGVCTITLVLRNEVFEDADVVAARRIRGVGGRLGTQDRMDHKLVTMELSVLLLTCEARV